MSVSTLTDFKRRASLRMVRDLSLAVPAEALGDPVALMSGKVRDAVRQASLGDRGRAAFRRRPWFGIPATPVISRLTSAAGEQSFHLGRHRGGGRGVAACDAYMVRQVEEEEEEEGSPAFLTTLDPDPLVRQRQWEEIEAFETGKRSDAGPPRLNLRYSTAPALMDRVAAAAACPETLRTLILAERDRVAAQRPLSTRLARDGVPWVDASAPETMAWIARLAGGIDRRPPHERGFTLSHGRSARPVLAGDCAFHRSIDDPGRKRILEGLATFIETTARDGKAGDRAAIVPIALAEHRPDRLNHPDNVHFHFLIGQRLVSYDADGVAHFAARKMAALTRRDWWTRMRGEIARLSNIELARQDADVRLHPGSHAAMGITNPVMTKLHGAATVLERAGACTDPGLCNAAEGWRRRFAAQEREHAEAMATIAARERARTGVLAGGTGERKRREDQLAKASDEEARAALLRHEAAQIVILVEMARSRAELCRTFAPAYADRSRSASGEDTYETFGWRQRATEASAVLAALDAEMAAENAAITQRRREADLLDARAVARRVAVEKDRTGSPLARRPAKTASPVRSAPSTALVDGVRLAAFDAKTGRPTKQLLMLLRFAGNQPNRFSFTEGRPVIEAGPGAILTLADAWRGNQRVSSLLEATVRRSAEAGHPVWPAEVVHMMGGRSTPFGHAAGRDGPSL